MLDKMLYDGFDSSVPEESKGMEVPQHTLTFGHCGLHCVTISFCSNHSLMGPKGEEVMTRRGLRG